MDVGHQSSPKTTPSAYLEEDSVFSQERMNFKSEDDFEQANVIDKNEGPKLDIFGANEEMRVEGTSSNTSEFPGNCHSKETPPFKSRTRGVVITRKNMDKIKGYDLKLCGSISSPSKQCLRPSECLPVSENHSASVRLNSLTKRTLHDYTAAALNKKKLPAQYWKAQFSSSIPVQESAPSQSDWTPFEFVDSSVIIKKEVTTNSDVFIDENTSSSQPEHILPSTSALTESSASPIEKKFPCEQCPATFKKKYDLKMHLLTHSSQRPFFCEQCSARFKIKSKLKKHMLLHSNERPFRCGLCSAQFKSRDTLRWHLRVHSNERRFSCDQCPDQFKTNSSLKAHLLTHSGVKAFSCNQCIARFRSNAQLKDHLLVHSDERAFSCVECSAQFKRKDNLRRHLLSHSNKKVFSCDHCSARFKSNHYLRSHMLVHANEEVFPCNQCSAQFKERQDLGVHLLTHTEGAFSCKHCSVRFQKASQLMSHSLNCSVLRAFSYD